MSIKGSVAYCAQVPWIEGDCTIRENILFRERFDEDWYVRVLEICQLISDLREMDQGDHTLIGTS